MSIKKILGITSTRSDYDLLSYLYKSLSNDKFCNFKLLVSGMHMSKTYGYTYRNIQEDGIPVLAAIETLIDSDSRQSRIKSASLLLQNCIHDVSRFEPDLILFAGDREDALVAAMLGGFLHVPTIHFFGGDHTTDGNIDNPVRHACSKLASCHFVTCEEHRLRLLRLGEETDRIFVIGSPSIDKLIEEAFLSKEEVFEYINLKCIPEKYAVIIFHPVIGDEDTAGEQFRGIVESLLEEGYFVLCGTPNVDSGNKNILKQIDLFANEKNFLSYVNLERNVFVNLLRHSNLLIGNSSAGIVEAATLKIPVINVGRRQVGRMTGGNVVFCEPDKQSITGAIAKINSAEYIEFINNMKNPYGAGNSSRKAHELIMSKNWRSHVSKTYDPIKDLSI